MEIFNRDAVREQAERELGFDAEQWVESILMWDNVLQVCSLSKQKFNKVPDQKVIWK